MRVPLGARTAMVPGPLAAHRWFLFFLRSSSPVVLPVVSDVDGRGLLGSHSDFGLDDYTASESLLGHQCGRKYVHAMRGQVLAFCC